MSRGKALWDSADLLRADGSAKSAKALRFFALGRILRETEGAALNGRDVEAAQHLRELQAHCEKLIGMVAPEKKGRPSVVAAGKDSSEHRPQPRHPRYREVR